MGERGGDGRVSWGEGRGWKGELGREGGIGGTGEGTRGEE